MFEPMSLLSNVVALDLSSLQQPPMSALAVLIITVIISLVTTLANRMVINMEEFKKFTIQSAHVRQDLMAAMRSGNQRLIAKAQKQQQEMMKVQQKMTMDRMKIMLFFFIPFILIWQVLGSFFRGVVAYMPFPMPWFGGPIYELSLSSWYVFCSFSSSIIIQRVLGLSFEIEPKKT